MDNQYITNGAGYTTNTGTVTSVGGTGTVSGLSLSGTVTTSGNLTLGGTISISSTNITDVDAFSQTGTYASLRAQGTTAGDVGLGNVTNESKSTMFASPTFTGTVAIPGFTDVSASLAAAVAGGDNLGNHTATTTLNLDGNNITNVDTITSVTNNDLTIDPGGTGGLILKSTDIDIQHSGVGAGSLNFYELGNAQYTRLQGQTVSSNITVNLPTSAGTLALTSDIPDVPTASEISGAFDSVSASLAADIPTNNNQLTNGAGYTTNTGTVTNVTVGTGLDVTSGTTTPNISLDLTEITVGTGLDTTATGISLDLTEVGFGAGAADRLITNDGDGTVTAEANLTFDGSTLNVDGKIDVDDSTTSGAIVDISNNTTSIMGADHYSLKVAGGQAIGTPGGQTKGYGGYFTAGNTNGTNPDTIALYAQGHEDGAPNSYAAIFSGSAGGVVGINTMEPEVELDIVGDLRVAGNITGSSTNILLTQPDAGGGASNYLRSSGDITSGLFLFELGDIDDNYNGTKLIIDDANEKVSIPAGKLELGAVTDVETRISSYRTQIVSNGFYSQADKRYLTFNTTGETTGFNYLSLMPAPANGRVISISVWNQSGGGSTVMGFHKNSNATASSTDTQTLTLGVPVTFTFSSGNTFSQNDELSFSIDPTSTPNGLFFSIILEYDY